MSYEETRQTIANYLKTNFTSYPLTPENLPYDPKAGQPWLRWGIRPADEGALEVGGKYERVAGMIWFQIFLPENSGSHVAATIGDTLVGLFFQKSVTYGTFQPVRCQSATLRYVGPDNTGWVQWHVYVPYTVDDLVVP